MKSVNYICAKSFIILKESAFWVPTHRVQVIQSIAKDHGVPSIVCSGPLDASTNSVAVSIQSCDGGAFQGGSHRHPLTAASVE